MRERTCAHAGIGDENARRHQPREASNQNPRQAPDQQHGTEGHDHQGRLAEVRLHQQQPEEESRGKEGRKMRWYVRTPRLFRQQPGGDDDEARLCQLRGLQIERAEVDPAMRTLDLGAPEQRRNHQGKASGEEQEAGAAGLPRREERHADQHQHRREEIEQLAPEEMEGVEADAIRDRRTGRHADQHAGGHEQDHRHHQSAVDGEPPLGEKPAVATSEQHCHLL